MAKQGNNIYKRKDGRWEGRYMKGRTPEGKAIYASIYGRDYEEVKIKLMPLKMLFRAKQYSIRHYCGTLNDWLRYWLEDVVKKSVNIATYESYRNTNYRYVFDDLGKRLLIELTKEDLERFLDDLKAKELDLAMIQNIFHILNSALIHAMDAGVIIVNPCADIYESLV